MIFRKKVVEQVEGLKTQLYRVETKRDLFEIYLNGFPLENRQHYNCNCCKSFIRHYGNLVAIQDGVVKTIWDFEIDGEYEGIPALLRSEVS